MSDPIAALVAWVIADPANPADDHVYGNELPDGVAAVMPRRAIVLAPSGGPSLTGNSDAEVDTQRVDLKIYATIPSEANAALAIVDRRLRSLKRETIAHCFIHWVNRAGGYSAARDRDGQWPMAFRSYQVFHALQEVQ